MKKVLTILMGLSIWIGAFANHEKATIIIKTSSQDQLEVKVGGIEQRSNQQQYVLQNLEEGKHLVTINKIVQSGYNQPTKKQLVYKGNVTAYKGMSTTYHLDRNVMRTGEKVAIPIPQTANQRGSNNWNHNGWNNGHGHHPPHGNGYNNGHGHNAGHGNSHNNGNQCNSCCNQGHPNPPHQNYCNHYNNYGYCNNTQCSYSGCQTNYNGGSWNNGYQHYNGYNYQNYDNYNWNNGYNDQGYNNGSGYNNQPYNNGYNNYNPNNNGNYNNNNPWNNGYKQPISNADFKKIMDRLQDQFTDKGKVDFVKLAFNQQSVSAQQVRAVVEELTFESNKLEVAKLLHPQTVNPQEYYLVSDAFTFSTNKKALSDFITQ